MIAEILALVAAIGAIFYWWATKNYSYWQNKGVKVPKGIVPYFGHLKDPFVFKSALSHHLKKLYNELSNERYENYIC
jgi:hypothetical protein